MPTVSEKASDYSVEPPARHVRLFRNGANQAVRIPKEFEPGFAGGELAAVRCIRNKPLAPVLFTQPATNNVANRTPSPKTKMQVLKAKTSR